MTITADPSVLTTDPTPTPISSNAPDEFAVRPMKGVPFLAGGVIALAVSALTGLLWLVLWARALGELSAPAPSWWMLVASVSGLTAGWLLCRGVTVVEPLEARVFVFLGTYRGSLVEAGTWWVNPFWRRQSLSLKLSSFTSDTLKVNDADGNPVLVAATVAWRITDTSKAAFGVSNLGKFVGVQTSAALRQVIHGFTYDRFTDGEDKDANEAHPTLVHDGDKVSAAIMDILSQRLEVSGAEVVDTRIADLSYAPEIAEAMLRRQQASAVVAARRQIVTGAVSMVHDALEQLESADESDPQLEFDPERRATFASNLMTVLVGDHGAMPVLNVGTLNR